MQADIGGAGVAFHAFQPRNTRRCFGHRLGQIETPAMPWLFAIGTLIALAGLVLGMVGLRQLWVKGHLGGIRATAGTFFSSLGLIPALLAGYLYFTTPPLTDVTTDADDLLVWQDRTGAGMRNDSSSPTLANVVFSDNWAYYGGGMLYAEPGRAEPLL